MGGDEGGGGIRGGWGEGERGWDGVKGRMNVYSPGGFHHV